MLHGRRIHRARFHMFRCYQIMGVGHPTLRWLGRSEGVVGRIDAFLNPAAMPMVAVNEIPLSRGV